MSWIRNTGKNNALSSLHKSLQNRLVEGGGGGFSNQTEVQQREEGRQGIQNFLSLLWHIQRYLLMYTYVEEIQLPGNGI